jgi:hypothetical protein
MQLSATNANGTTLSNIVPFMTLANLPTGSYDQVPVATSQTSFKTIPLANMQGASGALIWIEYKAFSAVPTGHAGDADYFPTNAFGNTTKKKSFSFPYTDLSAHELVCIVSNSTVTPVARGTRYYARAVLQNEAGIITMPLKTFYTLS